MPRWLSIIGFSLCVLAPAGDCWALVEDDARLDLPSGLPPGVYLAIEALPVFDVTDTSVRFVPMLPERYRSDVALLPNFPVAFMQREQRELVCDCSSILRKGEYVVSETPVRAAATGRYVSINDESYKAIAEVIDYPLASDELIAVAFSELAYVFNADAIAAVLGQRGFTLGLHRGFMNSEDYPGYRDTQFFLAVRDADGRRFLAVRGTSGAADVETSAAARLVPFGRSGRALAGFADVARFIYQTLGEAGAIEGSPLTLTGHSLGAAVSTLLAILLADDGVPARVLEFASPPVGDLALFRQYREILEALAVNYYLSNEELIVAERKEAARLVRAIGSRERLPDVGLTAGAAHYVINYLKSVLVRHGESRMAYEASLPHCVVVKYPCFGDRRFAPLVPACALNNEECFGAALASMFPVLPAARLDGAIEREKRRLVEARPDAFERDVAFLRLAAWNLERGNEVEAQRLIEALSNARASHVLDWLASRRSSAD